MLRLERTGRRAAIALAVVGLTALVGGSSQEQWQKQIDNCREKEWRKIEAMPRKYFRPEFTPAQVTAVKTCAAARAATMCAEIVARSDARAYLAIQSWANIERKECATVP